MSRQHHTSTDDQGQSPNKARRGEFDEQPSIIQSLFDTSPLLLGVAELDGNTILGVNGNPAVAQLLGLAPDDIPHRTGEELGNTSEEDQIWLEHYRQSQQEGKPVQFEYKRLNRNSPQWLSATVNYLGTGSQNRPRFSFIAEDITERKQLEQALEASERKYRELIQYAPIGFYEIDFRTGRLTSINDSAVELTGYSREELLQMTTFDLLDPESQALFKERICQWLSGEAPQTTVEYRIKAKDGHTIYTVLNVTFTRDEHGQPLGATVIGYDITERKQAEYELRRSEVTLRKSEAKLWESEKHLQKTKEQLQLALEASQLGIFDYDILTETHYWDHRSREIWGIGPEVVVTFETFLSGIHPDDREATLAANRQAFDPNGDGRYAAEYRVINQINQEVRWIAATGQVYFENSRAARLVGIVEDITDRKRMEQELANSERKHRELVQYAPSAIYEIDFQTLRFTTVNDAMSAMCGYSREELLAMSPFDLLDQQSQVLLRERTRQWQSGEQPKENVEYRVGTKDGRWIDVILNTTFHLDANGSPTGATVIAHDITERKQAERAITGAKEEAERNLAQLQTIVRNMDDGLIVADRHGNILLFNDAMRTLTGLIHTPNENYREYGERIAIHDQEGNLIPIQEWPLAKALRGENVRNQEIFVQRYDSGKSYTGLFSAAPVLDRSGQVQMAIVTIRDITERKRLEAEQQQAVREREIHHRLIEQREKERQSIARDIHDGPIQSLSSLAFSLQYLKETYTDPKLQLEISQIAMSVKDAVQELRQVMNELRPPTVIRFGLAKAILMHTENLRERYPHIIWNLNLDDDGQLMPEQTCLALFRIYQEAINNIIRHSEAMDAWVHYKIDEDQVTLEISDNGKGFENTQDVIDLTNNQHFGLAGMAERVQAMDGAFEIQSMPGKGTTIRVCVPIEK